MEPSAAVVCRICQGEGEPFVRPCRCEGSMAHAHPYCLAEWIASRGRLSCEVCGTAYTFELSVKDAPLLYSVRGATEVVALFIKTQLRQLLVKIGVAGRIAGGLLALTLCTIAIWLCFWRCMARGGRNARSKQIPFLLLLPIGFLLNIVPGVLVVCYERFEEWAFVYEDAMENLPPVPPVPPPPEEPIDEAAAASLNWRFRRSNDSTSSPGLHRYVSTQQTDVSAGVVLQLLRKKISATKKSDQRRSLWSNSALRYIATFLLIQVAFAGSTLLGDTTLRSLAVLARLLCATCSRLEVVKNSVLRVPLEEALVETPLFSALYWCSAFVVGIATLLYPLQLAAAQLAGRRVKLARTLTLVYVFTRSALSIAIMVIIWAVVVPVVVYACLFPFFTEGDAAVIMAPKEAWNILRSEQLLPFTCRAASFSRSPPPARPLTQPLNILRALVVAVPDVWQGRAPPLFDPVSCVLEPQRVSPQGLLAQTFHFACFCGCVLLRVCTLATWLTLVSTLRATFLWLLSGAFAVLYPYTSLAGCLHNQHEFFNFFAHLRGRGFWRVVAEIPVFVALYTTTIGFASFTVLYRHSPDAFPRSASYLPLYNFTSHFSECDFVYSWYRIIKATHTGLQTRVQRFFLSRGAPPFEGRLAVQGDELVERAACGVCLLCANVLIGVLIERLSWISWFPLLGFLLNLVCLFWTGVDVGGGFPRIRRRLDGWCMQATMLCFYGTWVTLKEGDLCEFKKISRVRSNAIVFSLLRQSFEESDVRLLTLLTELLDRHHMETVVCSRELLHRVTSHTLAHVVTYPRIAVVALLTLLAPLGLCSAWRMDFVTRLSTDYISLPLWFSLLIRWTIGALAGCAWCLAEGLVLHTALFQRSLEFLPQFILGTLSLEAVHAVVIPLAIHCGAVRFGIAMLEYFSYSALATAYATLPLMAGVVLVLLSVVKGWVSNRLWRVGRHVVLRGQPHGRQAAPRADFVPPPVIHPQRQQVLHQQHPLVEPAPVLHDVAVAAAAGIADESEDEGPHAVPLAEPILPPPPPPPNALPQPSQKSSFLCRFQERIARWAASEGATDVVLVDYECPPSSLVSP
ncbi:hypothetical protein ABL78_0591 [Leptomonas seymouri]|uniref:RING-CH-type domain-containing protein n=1 Tax=Leptomonas seymouri TaxID=5684 RepID=A0A0N1PFJ7_LEPSE|nr:hypothetical protein ABL78_0591 [Leptomonas seymouri]|eukprot:KPI90364.1 hypothetical protein ABL78_0591 [Leptomonas seymouri]